MTTRTPDWMVERLHAGDLPAEDAERVRTRLEAEGGLARLEALDDDDQRFRAKHPPRPALAEIRHRAAQQTLRRRISTRRVFLPAMAALAAGLVAIVLVPRGRMVGGPEDLGPGETREKGARIPHLAVHREHAGAEPEALAHGAAVRAGELLQLSYVSAGAPYGVVVSIDGRGTVTLHLPEGGGRAAPLEKDGAVPLAHAYQLDDAPGFERFILVTGAAPFDAGVVVAAARKLAALGAAETTPLALPRGLGQQSLLMKKR